MLIVIQNSVFVCVSLTYSCLSLETEFPFTSAAQYTDFVTIFFLLNEFCFNVGISGT